MPGPIETEFATDLAAVSDQRNAREPFAVVKEEVEIEINFRERSVCGVATIWIFPLVDELEEVSIDARQCEIDLDNITVDGLRTTATFRDPYERLQIPKQWQLGVTQHHIIKSRMQDLMPERRDDLPIRERDGEGCVPADGSLKISLRPRDLPTEEAHGALKTKALKGDRNSTVDRADRGDESGVKISIPFRSRTIRDGLHFVGVDEGDSRYTHVYTRHSIEPGTACCIFPCIDDPGSRHPWKLSIKCPRTLGDALEQPLATQPVVNGTVSSVAAAGRKRKHAEMVGPQSRYVLAEEDKLLEMTVVCSGNLSGEQIDAEDERKKIMTFDCYNSAAQHICFAVGPFEHVDLWTDFRTEESDEKLGANATKIHAYCLPGRVEEVQNTCAPVVAAADFFALELGKNPFDSYKMCFVEDMVSDTVTAASLSLCSTRLLYLPEIVDTEIDVTRKLVHSVACQYFGIRIVPNRRTDRWIVIGIQWFITDLFMRQLCGLNWYKFHIKTLCDRLADLDVNRPSLHDLGNHLHVGDFELAFMALKAPLVLFILDQRMSKYPGSTGVVRIVSQMVSAANISNLDPNATSISEDDFFRTCEKKSQYRPGSFWQQWVLSAGCPKLRINQKFNKKSLNVEILVNQERRPTERPISTDEFWREYQEEIHNIYAGEVPKYFTGPFTIRIHEADGTPYEHYLEVREDDRVLGNPWLIPYNTKYKRLKKSKRKDGINAAAAATTLNKQEMQEDDVVYFNMLGDVLTNPQEKDMWGLQEWDKDMQTQMDQESYEWIRFDCNFEWLAHISSDMPGYMYLAQLQQDRDVIAHQEAMLFFMRQPRHNMAATIETRTLMDRRYYHGIRTMAASDLPKHAVADLNYCGLAQLMLAYRTFFCYPVTGRSGQETWPPGPNDFSDKAQYAVQCAIPAAVARTRVDGRCSATARNFLLELILFNDNGSNEYSDQFFIAKLLEALATSMIPDKTSANPERPDRDNDLVSNLRMDDDRDVEFGRFIDTAMGVIDKYRRMDEWTSTYQNVWTTTALDCKMRLMKARVIPTTPVEFLQYCQDESLDLVRIKAFECLVELGMIAKAPILRLLLCVMSTDRSPFVRDRLFRSFCRGIAAIALGEHKVAEPEAPTAQEDQSAENDGEGDGDLIIEQGEAEIRKRKIDAVRKTDVTHALTALKEELKGNTDLQDSIWRALQSDIIGLKEKQNILELCGAMFEPDDTLLVTVNYPKYWKCTREPAVNGNANGAGVSQTKGSSQAKKHCIVKFTSHFRTEPRLPRRFSIPPPVPAVTAEDKPAEPKKIKLNTKLSFSGPSAGAPTAPAGLVRQPSISVMASPRVATAATAATTATALPAASGGDSIAVQPVARLKTPALATPAPAPAPAPVTAVLQPSDQQPNGGAGSVAAAVAATPKDRPKVPKKRKTGEVDGAESAPPGKKIKASLAAPTAASGVSKNGRPSRVVRLQFTKWHLLRPETLAMVRAADRAEARESSPTGGGSGAIVSTIVATPAAKRPITARASTPTVAAFPASTAAVPSSASGGGAKQRKPLPSSAPQGQVPTNGVKSNGGGGGSGSGSGGGSGGGGGGGGGGDGGGGSSAIVASSATPGPLRKLIKLKIKSSSSQRQSPSSQ